jgi:hypothetical protein
MSTWDKLSSVCAGHPEGPVSKEAGGQSTGAAPRWRRAVLVSARGRRGSKKPESSRAVCVTGDASVRLSRKGNFAH